MAITVGSTNEGECYETCELLTIAAVAVAALAQANPATAAEKNPVADIKIYDF